MNSDLKDCEVAPEVRGTLPPKKYDTEEERLYGAAFEALNALSKFFSQVNKPKMYEVNKAMHHLMDLQ